MSRHHTKLLLALISGALAVSAGSRAAEIDWYTIDCGGGQSTNGSVVLSGTWGQPDATIQSSSAGPIQLTGGFWVALPTPDVPIPGDCDYNGVVDLEDFSAFTSCLVGPALEVPPGCDCHDLDADGQVSLRDFVLLATYFEGS
jgi:hypothetical protein